MLPHPTTPRLLSITLFSATYCTDLPKYYSFPSCYTEALADYSTQTVEYYTEVAKYFSALHATTAEAAKYYAVPTCYIKAALSCYVEQKYYTAPFYYTTTYATTPNLNLSITLLQTTTKLRFIFMAIFTTMSPLNNTYAAPT
jgi:hypothetical protein